MLKDRIQAGQILAKKLLKYKSGNTVVVAIPKGGIPIGYSIANELGVPLIIELVEKIGHPNHSEFIIGVAGLTDYCIANPKGISKNYIVNEVKQIQRHLINYQNKVKKQDIYGKTVLLVDDGTATGTTLLYAIDIIKKRQPKEIVVAVPIASHVAVAQLKKEVAELIVLIIPPFLNMVSEFYKNFDPISDEEAFLYLEKINRPWLTSINQNILKPETSVQYKSNSSIGSIS